MALPSWERPITADVHDVENGSEARNMMGICLRIELIISI